MTNTKRMLMLLHVLTGGLLVIASVLANYILATPHRWGLMQFLTFILGLGLVIIGFGHRRMGSISRVSTNLCVSLLSLIVFLALGEGFFRGIGFDFAGEERAWRQVPPFFRLPIAPTGDVFFKRPGSEHWTGQVLNTRVAQLGDDPNPYAEEPVITVDYDRRGFRNPDQMTNWTVAVAGDSFTELGNLAYEQLFTSILAQTLNVSVLNLGTSHTGPLTQLSYLRDYGIATNTKHTIIVFFEGNDLEDLADEHKALVRWQETGERDYREFRKQPSLVRALYKLLRRVGLRKANPITAYFKSSQGKVPVSLTDIPPGRDQISKATMHQLDFFFRQYHDFGSTRQITLWLAYMPCKLRVIHGQVEFTARAPEKLKNWQPTDLPEVISEMCKQYEIKFIDLTPALIRETSRNQQLLYNSLYDTHLNSLGSRVVGQELERQLSGQIP